MTSRQVRGSIAPAFNAGLVVGVVLFTAALYPLIDGLSGGWRLAGYAAGALFFWIIGVNAILGAGQALSMGLLALAVAAAWIARSQGAASWVPPSIVLAGAFLGAIGSIWRSVADDPEVAKPPPKTKP